VLKLIKFNLPSLHKSTAFLNPTDYLSEYALTITVFDPAAIPVPPYAVVKDPVRAILSDKDICSIVLVHSPQHRDEDQRYSLWFATLWARMERARQARTLWRTAADGIHEMLDKISTSKEAAERARQALTVLADLGWTGNLRGLKAGGTISVLVLWFNQKWLRTSFGATPTRTRISLFLVLNSLFLPSSFNRT
jgi:hypothetical protein